MTPDTMVLLPAFNESHRIGVVIEGIRESVPECRIVVVDDGSTDDTTARALNHGVTVLRLPFNLGYGVALQTGYKYAVTQGVRFLVQLDADGQHDPANIPALLERVTSGSCDVCIGSRFLEGEPYTIPFVRRIGMALFRRVASRLLGQTVTDPTSGFQAMNRRVLEFFSRDSYPVDYPDVDVLVMLHRHGFHIGEAPVVMHARIAGASLHRGFRPVYYLFKMGLDIPLNLIRREK
jgi:hypothetical protein